jgi:hypothetical protein
MRGKGKRERVVMLLRAGDVAASGFSLWPSLSWSNVKRASMAGSTAPSARVVNRVALSMLACWLSLKSWVS